MQPPRAKGDSTRSVKVLTTLGVLALVVAGFVLAFFLLHTYDSQSRQQNDSALKRTADRLTPALKQPDSAYALELTFYRTYVHWVRDLQRSLNVQGPKASSHGQFEQVQAIETRTVPPQYSLLTIGGRRSVTVDGQLMLQVAHSGVPVYSDVHVGNTGYRVYMTRIPVPYQLVNEDTFAVLEVFQK